MAGIVKGDVKLGNGNVTKEEALKSLADMLKAQNEEKAKVTMWYQMSTKIYKKILKNFLVYMLEEEERNYSTRKESKL